MKQEKFKEVKSAVNYQKNISIIDICCNICYFATRSTFGATNVLLLTIKIKICQIHAVSQDMPSPLYFMHMYHCGLSFEYIIYEFLITSFSSVLGLLFTHI